MQITLIPFNAKDKTYGPLACLRARFDGHEFNAETVDGQVLNVPTNGTLYAVFCEDDTPTARTVPIVID